MPRLFTNPAQYPQDTASDTWTINHGLNGKPTAAVFVNFEGKLQQILPAEVSYPSNTQVVIKFSQPFTGVVRLV